MAATEIMLSSDDGLPADVVIARFLEEKCPEYHRLADLRRQGWADPRGDQFFANQRRNADMATPKTASIFYEMMQKIAQDMQSATQALHICLDQHEPHSVLDLCASPGGFMCEIMRLNPHVRVRAFSLPSSDGGHKLLLPKSAAVDIEYLDITLLAEDMDVADIPSEHPDSKSFLKRHLNAGETFNLVFCDGQVLRAHNRAVYRERCEAQRLTSTQLALGLKHVRPGGTMIILLHKLHAWETIATVFRFSQFSSVRLFKPNRIHSKRSSFYLIATNIQSNQAEAVAAREVWRDVWETATFFSERQGSKAFVTDGLDLDKVLTAFGETLIELGRPIWAIQADALARAPFMQHGLRQPRRTQVSK